VHSQQLCDFGQLALPPCVAANMRRPVNIEPKAFDYDLHLAEVCIRETAMRSLRRVSRLCMRIRQPALRESLTQSHRLHLHCVAAAAHEW
jgi:hypothetical protein